METLISTVKKIDSNFVLLIGLLILPGAIAIGINLYLLLKNPSPKKFKNSLYKNPVIFGLTLLLLFSPLIISNGINNQGYEQFGLIPLILIYIAGTFLANWVVCNLAYAKKLSIEMTLFSIFILYEIFTLNFFGGGSLEVLINLGFIVFPILYIILKILQKTKK